MRGLPLRFVIVAVAALLVPAEPAPAEGRIVVASKIDTEGALLGIAYQTASVLKRKLQLSKIPGDDEPLQGLVEANQTEISIQGFSRTFGHVTADNIVVAIALEVPDGEPAHAEPSTAPRSYRIRLAAVPDNSPASIEPFIRANVRCGAILLIEDFDELCLRLLDYGYDLRELGETPPHVQHVFSALKRWFSVPVALGSDAVEARLKAFVAEVNWRVSFDRVLQLALRTKPTTCWDIVGHDNPRRGGTTVRRNPRRRKTATGMRQDGSGRTQAAASTHGSDPPLRGSG